MTDELMVPQEYVQHFPLADMVPHPQNAKLHDLEGIGEAIDETGFHGVIKLQKGTHYILAGHGRRDSLLRKEMTHAPVLILDVDDALALKILLQENWRDTAGFDEEKLEELLASISVTDPTGLAGTGYDEDFLDALRLSIDGPLVMDPAQFTGGYVESDTELAARSEHKAETKAAKGLREFVLAYMADDYERVVAALHLISEFHGTATNADTVKVALLHYATQLEADNS